MPDEECILFDDSPEKTCPITLAHLKEIKCPVAFRDAPLQPYEASALAEWLSVRRTNPLTNLPCYWDKSPFEVLVPLNSAGQASLSSSTIAPEDVGAEEAMAVFNLHILQSGGNAFDQVSRIWPNLWHSE